LSNGEVFENYRLLKNNLRKLRKLQRSLSRKVKESNRYAKAKLKIQKLHFLIARQRAAIADVGWGCCGNSLNTKQY
jgi:putative transposase